MRLTTLEKNAAAHEEGIWAAAWLPDTHRLLTGSVDESVKIWDVNGEKLEFVHTLSGFSLGVISLTVDAAGQYGAASALDSNIRVWDMATYETKHIFDLLPTELWSIAFGPATPESISIAAAGGSTHKVIVYTSGAEDEGQHTTPYELPPGENRKDRYVLSVAYSPDGKLLAAGAQDGTVAVWDVGSGSVVANLKGHHKPVRKVTFTPDSRLLLTACDDMHAHLYDVHQGGLVDAFSGHESWVLDVAVHPNGSAAVSGSSDSRVKLWDLGTRTCAQTLTDHSDQVWAVAFSSDGSRLATAADDKQLIISSVA